MVDIMDHSVVGYDKKKLEEICSSIMVQKLPQGINVSTMTITGKFETDFDIKNIGKYIPLKYDTIRSKKYRNITYSIDSNGNISKGVNNRSRNNSKPTRNFYNQTTVEVISPIKNGTTKVKLFQNGAIQMTGCKSYKHFIDVMQTLINVLHSKKAVLVIKDGQRNIIKKQYMEKEESIELNKLTNFNVNMINSNLHIGYEVDRDELYKLLLEHKVNCKFDPISHASVDIKYPYKGEFKKMNSKGEPTMISVFVFQSGSVIITGARHYDHIIETHEFICRLLYDNYSKLVDIKPKELIEELLEEQVLYDYEVVLE